jgi:putative membrane protein
MKTLVLAAALAALALPATAQTAKNTQQFVNKAAISDMFEIESSKLAQQKSDNNEIKHFAQKMVNDHTKTTNEMKPIVQKIQGMQMPSEMDVEHKSKLEQLRSASGAQFDQRYRMQQIEGHQAAVALFQDYANSGDNGELKAFAQKTLPDLRKHLQEAQALPQAQAPGVAAAPSQNRTQAQAGQAQKGADRQTMAALATPGPNHVLASDLRGTRVKGPNNENIGDINDILLDRNGQVVAAIVGVGGFLGIGEKSVAVPFKALEIAEDQPTTGAGSQQQQGTIKTDRIVLRGVTKADLEAAPNFRSDGNGGRTGGQAPRTGTQGGSAPRQ